MYKRKKITLIIPLLISSLILVLSIWCGRNEPHITPQSYVKTTVDAVDSDKEYHKEELITPEPKTNIQSDELKFVTLPAIKGKKTISYVEGKVTIKTGGHLHLDYHKPGSGPARVHIKIDLKIRPHSVYVDSIWSMQLDTTYLMLVLGPDGLEFLNPVTLCINAQNLDLSEMNPNSIGLYYYNEDKNNWELVEPIRFNFVINKGHIVGCWYIDHFSRYAIASR
jgi:hypothetical protein